MHPFSALVLLAPGRPDSVVGDVSRIAGIVF
jgi:hypothetical protein